MSRNTTHWILLVLITAGLLAVNERYYRANTRIPTYDEAWYLETSLRMYHALHAGHPGEFVYHYRTAFLTKAPLISVLPLPFYFLFGASHHAALLANSAFIVITNVYLFLLARRLFSPEVGVAAVVFYQTMPLAYGLSRTLMVEYGLAALVVVWLYYLVASEGLARPVIHLVLGVVLGLGLLTKILLPAFIVGPLLLVWLRGGRPWRPLAAMAVPAILIAATWYAFNLGNVLRFAWSNAYGDIAAGYGERGLAKQALLFVNQGLGFGYAVLCGVSLWLARPKKKIGFLLAWLLPPLAAMAAGKNLEIRFALPLLPAIAIWIAVSIFNLGRRTAVHVILALLAVALPLRLYAALSTTRFAAHPVALGPFAVLSRDLGWAHSPDDQGAWNQQRIIQEIHQLDRPNGKPHYVIVGVEHPYLNANLLSYLNAYTNYPLRFTSLGYAESSADRAIERMR
ncbi:MAG: glycosyltransferase family 39 protein, partial [Acidobacteria bacterium]|nr:glycosyltransferase family 39 protein [Acidobacteriota bacterium]